MTKKTILLLVSFALVPVFSFANCPTQELIGKFQAKVISCEDQPIFVLSGMVNEASKHGVTLGYIENGKEPSFKLSVRKDSDTSPRVKCENSNSRKSFNWFPSAFSEESFGMALVGNKYFTEYGGCQYELIKQ